MSKSTALTKSPEVIEAEISSALDKRELIEAAEFSGAMRFAQRQADVLSAQVMHALETFQQTQRYLALGYETFVDYLDKHPSSPMTKHQYYERKKLLEQEGDAEFDLLNSLNVPARQRKLLSAGDIVLDGDQLIVGEKSVAINDPKAVRKVIAQAVERFERIEATAKKSEKEIEKLKKRLDEAREQAANAAPPASDLGDDADLANLRIISGLTTLKRELLQLPKAQRTQRFAQYRHGIEQALEDLFTSLTTTNTAAAPESSDDLDLSDEDLAELMED